MSEITDGNVFSEVAENLEPVVNNDRWWKKKKKMID